MKVGIYSRVSTQEQAREGYSIGEQVERLKNYCAAKGWILYKTYTDAGFSGANTDRPGMQQLISDVADGKIDMVLVYKLDRLSRSQKDTLYLIEDVFIKNNVNFASITENFDTSTPFGRAMIGILSVFAQLEREQFRERSIMGKDARAKEGLHHGGGAPTGYDYIDGQLIINKEEAELIKEAYRLFLEDDMTMMGIAAKLSVFSEKFKYDHRIRKMLTNPLYAGWTHCRDELYKGQHEAIISQEVFDKVQTKLKIRAENNPHYRNAFNRTSLLAGILWCKKCGARYFKRVRRYEKGSKVYYYNKYQCYSRSSYKNMVRDKSCKNKIWTMDVLDKAVIDEIKALVANPAEVDNIIKLNQSNNNITEKKEFYKKRIKEIEKQMNKLTDLYSIDGIDIDFVAKKITALNTDKKRIETEMNAINEHKPLISAEDAKKRLSGISNILDNGEFTEKVKVITSLINRIEVDDDDIYIYWNFV
ncbi:recombinase family protein [Firmicutes bacterium AM55-24TS]|jgi:site-specific DNA recombinase|nr:recombinase family protein [Firmicutes bacterium AM55-24TS]RHP09301.1 recombinase family protein [Firmicutes bacterium AF36-3BH]